MTHGRLSIGVVALAAALAGACGSSSKTGSPGTAGTNGAAGTSAAAGTSGAAGTSATAGTNGAAGTGATAGTSGAAGALATPTELVSAPACGNLRLVLSNGTIYYTNKAAGTVSSVAVGGGTPKVIAMAQSTPNPIAVDATSVYWGNDGDKTVMKSAIANGTPAVFVPAATAATATDVANALLVDGTTLYIGRGLSSYKISTAGGALTQLSASTVDMGYPSAFALDATHLYQAELAHLAITRETIDGMQDGLLETGTRQALAPDRIAVSQSALVTDAIEISGQNVVWANGPAINFHDKDKDETEATFTQIATSAGFNPLSGFVLSGGKIYVGESGDNNIEVVPLSFTVGADGAPAATVIASNQANPSEFAADATNIYWTAIATGGAGACKIMKLAK